jgi:hypothetical protein
VSDDIITELCDWIIYHCESLKQLSQYGPEKTDQLTYYFVNSRSIESNKSFPSLISSSSLLSSNLLFPWNKLFRIVFRCLNMVSGYSSKLILDHVPFFLLRRGSVRCKYSSKQLQFSIILILLNFFVFSRH